MGSSKGGKSGVKVHAAAIFVALLVLFLLPRAIFANITSWDLLTTFVNTSGTVYGHINYDATPPIADTVYAKIYQYKSDNVVVDWFKVDGVSREISIDGTVYQNWWFKLNNMPAGTYTVWAKAYDDRDHLITGSEAIVTECIKDIDYKPYETLTVITTGSDSTGGRGGGYAIYSGSGSPITTAAVSGTDGGVFGFTAGYSDTAATVDFPAHVMSKDFNVTYEIVPNVSELSLKETEKLISKVFEFTKDVSGNFLKDVTIILPFDKDSVDTAKYGVFICYYNESAKEWVKLKKQNIYYSAGRVSGDIEHFTKFAVLAIEKEQSPTIKQETGLTDVATNIATTVAATDIAGHWAKADIDRLVNMGAITGYPDNTFRPENPITRAEFATVLVKALDLPQTSGKTFDDTAGHWASSDISTTVAYGIVIGYDEFTFGPDDQITREEIAAMVIRGKNLPAAAAANDFIDSYNISPWAESVVAAASANGIIGGYPDNSFSPLSNATKAEAATMIARALDASSVVADESPPADAELDADTDSNADVDADTGAEDAGVADDAEADDS